MRVLLTAGVAALSLCGAAFAQDAAPAADAAALAQAAPAAAPAAEASVAASLGVSRDELLKMSVLNTQLTEIMATHRPLIDAAADADAKGALETEMYDALNKAVAAQDLTIERYNALAALAAESEALRLEMAIAAQEAEAEAAAGAQASESAQEAQATPAS